MIDYDTWIEGAGGTLTVPVGEPEAVGRLLGELFWSLRERVLDADIPAIDYAEAAMPKRPGAASSGDGGRRMVIINRYLDLENLLEGVIVPLRAKVGGEQLLRYWALTRLPTQFRTESGTVEPFSYREVGRLEGVDHKTVSKKVAEVDRLLCDALAQRGWQL